MMSSKKKLCTMSHASLVSFNSTIPGVQSSLLVTSASDLPMRTIKLCSVLFGVSVDACCHKQDSLMCDGLCEKRTSTLCAINYSTVENVDDSPPFTDPKTILVGNRNFCPSQRFRSEYCHHVWCEKTRMVWLPNGEKVLKICLLVLTQYTNMTNISCTTYLEQLTCQSMRQESQLHRI